MKNDSRMQDKSVRRFYIDPQRVTDRDIIIITGPDAHHIRNVLRLGVGNTVELFNGGGKVYHARIHDIGKTEIKTVILSEKTVENESPVRLTVAQGMLKGKKMDILIRQLVEIGMNRFIPFFSERSLPRIKPVRAYARRTRWEKIVRESLKQCKRNVIPEICLPVEFDKMLHMNEKEDLKILFWEGESMRRLRADAIQCGVVSTATIVVGSEGGFTKSEVVEARNAGFRICGLGPRILKADTAAITAAAIIQYELGDMGNR